MFHSILFLNSRPEPQHQNPQMEKDLHLQEIRDCFLRLCPWEGAGEVFETPLQNPEEIRFRQEICRDLENPVWNRLLTDFSAFIRELQNSLRKLESGDLPDRSTRLWLAGKYCESLESLAAESREAVTSRGLGRFLSELDAYLEGETYRRLKGDFQKISEQFRKIRFCLLIKEGKLKVRPYEDQPPLDQQVRQLFSRFQGVNTQKPQLKVPEIREMHHIDHAILSLLSRVNPGPFEALGAFGEKSEFPDPGISRFAEEICFYTGWERLVSPLRAQGLPMCCPGYGEGKLFLNDGFDLSLALSQQAAGKRTVTNSFVLKDPERILVVTGPNQGGKTTFARQFGQAFYLGSLGLTVPGSGGNLRTFDRIYSHFNREEDLADLSGKLQDDILRLKEILDTATDRSILVINEIYASTTLEDAIALGKKMMESVSRLGALGICVTFLDELTDCTPQCVSMVSTVAEGQRTYQVVRKQADGLAYAMTLARKYGLDYEQLCRRLE